MLRFFAAFRKDLKAETAKHEAVFLTKPFKDFIKLVAVNFDNPVTLFADNMQVVVYPERLLIVRVFMAEVYLVDQMKLEQQVESVVDRCS